MIVCYFVIVMIMMKSTARLGVLKNDTSHLFWKTRNVTLAHICSQKKKYNYIETQTRQLSQKISIFLTNLLHSSWWDSCGWQVVENPDKCQFINSLSLPAVTGQSAGDNQE